MLHIIIVLGGTVFTEEEHYSLVNCVLGGGGGGGAQNKGGGAKFTMTPGDRKCQMIRSSQNVIYLVLYFRDSGLQR